MSLVEKFRKAKSDPFEARLYILSLIRGKFFTLKIKTFYPRIQIGARFRARSKIIIKGPGKVLIGDDVTVDLSFLRIPSIITHTRESCVTIKNGSYLGGTRISCVGSVVIGEEGLCGSSTIIDSDIIPTAHTIIDSQWIARYVSPIRIGSHFWAWNQCFYLKRRATGR